MAYRFRNLQALLSILKSQLNSTLKRNMQAVFNSFEPLRYVYQEHSTN